MRRPGVLFLHHNALLGGSERHLADVSRDFRETSAVILFSDGPLRARLERDGVRVLTVPVAWALAGTRGGAPRLNFSAASDILRLAFRVAREARRYQVIYANTPKALIVAALAGPIARRPVVWSLHDLLDPSHFSPAAIRLLVFLARRTAARVLANSDQCAADFVPHGGDPGCTFVLFPGTDTEPFDRPGKDPGALRAQLGLGAGPVAGVFGRITEWKGQHVAIELLARHPGLQLLVVGDPEEPAYAGALRRRAGELGAAGRVRWLGHREDVADLMRLVDVVLHTSTAPEPFGRVVVEGMLAGRAVIATAGGGIPEIVEDGVNGLVVPPGDVDALEKAVAAVLADPARARAMAAAGCEKARRRFTLDIMLSEVARHLSEVVQG